MKAIGIDIGTTSICAVVIDTEEGDILYSSTENSDAFIHTENAYEKIQDTEKMIRMAKAAVDRILDGEQGGNVSVIGVTGQMHGIVYTDREGKAISPLYTWQDKRGDLKYKDTTYAGYLNSAAGYGGVTDLYNRLNGIRPEEAVCYCTIHDYLVMSLCGLKTPIIHVSDAASFGNGAEHGAVVKEDFYIAGTYRGIPVSVAIGDNQASVFSSVTEEGDVLINVGTGAQVSVISDMKTGGGNIEARPYFDGKYLLAGSALCGGRAYSMLKDFYMDIVSRFAETDEKTVYTVMDEMLRETPLTDLKADTRFAGTREDSSVKGSFRGISTENFSAAHFTRAVLSGMAEEFYSLYEKMNVKCKRLIGSGNGIRLNQNLVKACEERFGAKMYIPLHREEAAFGAALYGSVSVGMGENDIKNKQIIKYAFKN